jgi:murein DD-endopeptidase MepM/ murein hydrolase activator NlpD
MKKFVLLSIFFLIALPTQAAEISIFPQTVLQGEPFLVSIDGITSTSSIKNITFDGINLGVFINKSKPAALAGVDLYKKPGDYSVIAKLADGKILQKKIHVSERKKVIAPLGIPQKLGGNTPASQTALVTSLSTENQLLNSLFTGKKSFWSEKFRLPLTTAFVTDGHGYSRQTGSYSIAHKGTDFRAKEGTPVMAMNRGVVRFARETRVYGKTIAVDHGLGLMTFYMHLSNISVNEGQLVLPGQVIGKSGSTGYAEFPHLHMSVKINSISIDPMKFMQLSL